MKRFNGAVIYDASKAGCEVMAETPAEAAEAMLGQADMITLCHQCSHDIDLGDPIRAIVYDDEGSEYDEREPPGNLRERCRELLEWKRTGLLKQGGAIQALAATLTEFDDLHRISQAERQTLEEAAKFVVYGGGYE